MTDDLKRYSTQSNVPQEENKMKRSDQNQPEKTFRRVRIRLIPIWLRIVLVLILLFLATTIGIMIGYGVIGDGKPLDALKWGTWQHILDIITGKE